MTHNFENVKKDGKIKKICMKCGRHESTKKQCRTMPNPDLKDVSTIKAVKRSIKKLIA